MAGIICPQCQRANPDETLFCQYCQSSLSPKLPEPGNTGAGNTQKEEGVPAWLAAIRERRRQESGFLADDEGHKSNLDALLDRLGGGRKEVSTSQPKLENEAIGEKPAETQPLKNKITGDDASPPETSLDGPEVSNQPAENPEDLAGIFTEDLAVIEPGDEQDSVYQEELPLAYSYDGFAGHFDPPPVEENEGFDQEEVDGGISEDTMQDSDNGLEIVEDNASIAPVESQDEKPPAGRPLEEIQGTLPAQEINYQPPETVHQADSDKPETGNPLFESILRAEREPRPATPYRRNRTSFVVRWIIAAALLFMISLIQIFKPLPERLPTNIPIETANIISSLSGVRIESNILLVLDYEPAYAGEIETAAGAALRLLADRHTTFFAISTAPHNLFLSDKLLNSVMKAYPASLSAYSQSGAYVTLGYLPGGQAGMKNLLLDFKGSLPLSLDLVPTSMNEELSSIQQLNGFDGIMILTDNPDTACTWVEQIQPYLAGPKLWMAVSSQAVPLLRPYLRSGQIDGLIGGIYGATSVEQVLHEPGPATALWNGYYYALISSLFIILTGGILNYFGFTILQTRRGSQP